MGLKGLMTAMGMNLFALVSLVFFFGSFLAITIWLWTRSHGEMDACARLYQDDEGSSDCVPDVIPATEFGDERPNPSP